VNLRTWLAIGCLLTLGAGRAHADLVPGLLSDFEDGTLQGWTQPRANTSNVPSDGSAGHGARMLQISPASPSDHLATFNRTVAGAVALDVVGIEVDMMRPVGEADLEIRLVLFGPGTGNRWTSALPQVVRGNGEWNTYAYSILESDLVRVLGLSTYAELLSSLSHIMLRYDALAPDATGTAGATGALNIDNVFVVGRVPEPSAGLLLGAGVVFACLWRRDEQGGETGASGP
jgi:hypothetical protein